MKAAEVHKAVAGLCCMSYEQATTITGLILDNRFQRILELGFHHGVSTCYMAGALQELGGGHITTIDLVNARDTKPGVEELLGRLGLQSYVTAHFEPTSYTWRLMQMLDESPAPRFDFCYLDGAHDWFSDGFAFFLVDRLLEPGGLIVFDDLDWTYDISPSLKDTERVRRMPADERRTPQIRKVYELLVKKHPDYTDFAEREGWAYARKRRDTAGTGGEIRREVVYETRKVGLGAALLDLARRIKR
jgi:predicted O-methyltransferase YrrM